MDSNDSSNAKVENNKPTGNEAEVFILKLIIKIVGVTAILAIGVSIAAMNMI
jgi:hypothetical protein